MTAIILPTGTFFLADTEANPDPTEDEIAETTILSAAAIRRFGIVPKAALLSHSNFGTDNSATARKIVGKSAHKNPADDAAWVLTARVLMNLDELITRE